MKFRSLSILILIAFGGMAVLAQNSDEEKLRFEFVRNLKSKNINRSDQPRRPVLNNDNTPVSDAKKTNDDDVIKIDTHLVRMDILVRDEKGIAILDLKPEDFVITENKLPQEVGTFSLGNSKEVPRSIVLIIDYSGSQLPYIKTSVEAAKVLVDKLNPRDTMAIVTDDVELLVDFTQDKALLKNSLDKLRKKAEKGDVGRSLQFSALYVTLQKMFDAEDLRPIVIFQTDGDQLLNIRTPRSPIELDSRTMSTFTDVEMLDMIDKSRVTLYSVISGFSLLGLSPEERLQKAVPLLEKQFPRIFSKHPEDVAPFTQILFRQQNAMTNIARVSGGFSENLEMPEQADAIYDRILNGITNRYLIGYYPTNQDRDGKRRNVKIEVRGHPEYIVLGRKFYYAPLDKKNN